MNLLVQHVAPHQNLNLALQPLSNLNTMCININHACKKWKGGAL